ncbi:MAG TPA: MSMEG_0567/Sll0786 family nitrogen starvation N-acetyltransferase [Nocardioidaceae bacterium]|nr:MSMEG_0567/Sll0786 family nitrogen starvation N-acetyltransferase [Nocardioidaceae bacterium]
MPSDLRTAALDPGVRAARAARDAPVPAGVVCWQVRSGSELAEHFAIRHRVFVEEQGVFRGSDRDGHDDDPATIALIAYCDGVVAGTVRLFPLDEGAGQWQGDRLAVLEPFRTGGVGAPLVRCAVATAGVQGGQAMSAHIQVPNTSFFRRLGWRLDGEPEVYAGLPHQPMSIVLPSAEEGAATVLAVAGAGVSAPDR